MKPTPIQARLLRFLAAWPTTVPVYRDGHFNAPKDLLDYRHPESEDHRGSYYKSFGEWNNQRRAEDLQHLRAATLIAMQEAGLLERVADARRTWQIELRPTAWGRQVWQMMALDEFVDVPRARPDVVSAADMLRALQERFNTDQGWTWFVEWAPGPTSRRVDAMAFNRWRHRFDNARLAFEIKRSRGDFLNELKDPRKRAPALRVATGFYFVTPAAMVQPAEIPGECGLIYVDEGQRASVKRKAPKLAGDGLTWELVADMVQYLVGSRNGQDLD